VFCEKPLARTLADAEAMVRAADEARVTLAVGHVVRFFPEYRQAKELLDAGTLGKPAIVTMTRGNFAVGSARGWYLDEDKSGGVVLDLMLHDLDTVRWWFGEPSRIYAKRFKGSGGSSTRSRRSATTIGRSCRSKRAGPSTPGSAPASSSAAIAGCSCTTAARRRPSRSSRRLDPQVPR
jgi:predicted dehydrogenase